MRVTYYFKISKFLYKYVVKTNIILKDFNGSEFSTVYESL